MADENPQLNRREFLQRTLLAAGTAAIGNPLPAPAATASAAPSGVSPPQNPTYLSFGPDEAALMEFLVNLMCPADHLTPNGVDCGLALFIDRQLAGAFGRGERLYRRGPWRRAKPELGYQLPLTPEEFFKAGLAAADAASVRKHGAHFVELTPADADRLLTAIADGQVSDERVPLSEWFNDLLLPLFQAACFADPLYLGNQGKVFWKMIGYPGLPAVNGLNVTKYRGKPFPGSQSPQSIADFT